MTLGERWRALGILVTLFVLIWVVFIGPIVTALEDQSQDLEQSLRLLSGYKNALESRPRLEADLTRFRLQGRSASGLIDGNSSALAAARLQSDIRMLVEQNGGEIRSTQNLPVSSVGSFEKVDIGCDFSIPMGHLKDLVYKIEALTPYIFIDKVDIRMPENWQPANENAIAPKLEVRWVVSGYRWAGS